MMVAMKELGIKCRRRMVPGGHHENPYYLQTINPAQGGPVADGLNNPITKRRKKSNCIMGFAYHRILRVPMNMRII
jgi:hypothetical protein